MLVLNVLMTAFIKHLDLEIILSHMILDHIVDQRALSVFILLLALCCTMNAPITYVIGNVMDVSKEKGRKRDCFVNAGFPNKYSPFIMERH